MRAKTALLTAAIGLLAAGCGSTSPPSASSTKSTTSVSIAQSAPNPNAKEKSPPGDIPDSTQFVRYRLPAGGFSVRIPEGWSRTGAGSRVTFTSNLNSVTVEGRTGGGALSVAAVKSSDVPALAKSLKGFRLQSVATISRSGEQAVRIRYLARSAPNAVTGRALTDQVERYIFSHNGNEAVVTLAGPNGADNVDAWRTMSNSVVWAR
jgi:hypothetical protein